MRITQLPFGVIATVQQLTTRPVEARACMYPTEIAPDQSELSSILRLYLSIIPTIAGLAIWLALTS